MIFIDQKEEEHLNKLCLEAAVSRDKLEEMMGSRPTRLLDALSQCRVSVNRVNWCALGIRSGLLRLDNVIARLAFLDTLKLTEDIKNDLVSHWSFPFSRNRYKQLLVAVAPGKTPSLPHASVLAGGPLKPIFTCATIEELTALRKLFETYRIPARQ